MVVLVPNLLAAVTGAVLQVVPLWVAAFRGDLRAVAFLGEISRGGLREVDSLADLRAVPQELAGRAVPRRVVLAGVL